MSDLRPPVAKRVPTQRVHHGDTVVDEYAWLANQDDPDTIAYLTAENEYTQAAIAHLADLRRTVCEDIKRRTQQTDHSVMVRMRHRAHDKRYWYYSWNDEIRHYDIH